MQMIDGCSLELCVTKLSVSGLIWHNTIEIKSLHLHDLVHQFYITYSAALVILMCLL